MAANICPSINARIKFFENLQNSQQSKKISGGDTPYDQIPEKPIGPFVQGVVRKLGLPLKTEKTSIPNSFDTPQHCSNHVECFDKAVQTDLGPPEVAQMDLDVPVTVQTDIDLAVSHKKRVAYLASQSPYDIPSPTVVLIDNVENFNQEVKDCRPNLFQACLRGTKRKMMHNHKFQTGAMKHIMQTLESIGKVGVRGDTCSGKTSVLYGVMQMFGKKYIEWNIIFVENEQHLSACYKKEKVLLVIDDILDENINISKYLADLKNYIDQHYWKVLFSYSNESYLSYQRHHAEDSFLDGGHVLNISVGYTCTEDEKIQILNFHCRRLRNMLQKESSKHCLELVPGKYFFNYVRRYVNTLKNMGKCDPINFFRNPITEMMQDLENLKRSNHLGFYILFCCSVLDCNLDISTSFQMQLSEHAMEVSKWLLTPNDKPDQNSSLETMQSALDDVPKEFIEIIGNHQYRIKYDCVLRTVQLIILKELNIPASSDYSKLFNHALLVCDSSIVHTFLQSEENVSNSLQLKLHPKNFQHLAKRFVIDIQSGHVQGVGHHPLFGDDDFKHTFISRLGRKYDQKDIWDIFSKLDINTKTALIVFAVKHDKPGHAIVLTNFILNSKKWNKYSRKKGKNVERHLLVLQQNVSALKIALQNKNQSALLSLLDSVFINLPKISEWKGCWRDEAIRIIIEVHGEILSEKSEITKEVMKLFQKISIGAYINQNKQSLLHLCVTCRNEQLLERVVKHRKGEMKSQDTLGQDPLHTAVQENNLMAVKILIKAGAVAGQKDMDGNSALHLAVNKNKEILDNLIRVNGTDVNIRNKLNKTPLQLARELGKTEHVDILRQADVIDD